MVHRDRAGCGEIGAHASWAGVPTSPPAEPTSPQVPLATIAREWGRIGITGFGGPPAPVAVLGTLCVEGRHWISAPGFEDAVAAAGLRPGPASTQLAIFCAGRLAGLAGAVVGGACFIDARPRWSSLRGRQPSWPATRRICFSLRPRAQAAPFRQFPCGPLRSCPLGWARVGSVPRSGRPRWVTYAAAGALAAALAGLAGAGPGGVRPGGGRCPGPNSLVVLAGGPGVGGLQDGRPLPGGRLCHRPLVQYDAVHTYHWMTGTQVLGAVALDQLTPGPGC